MQILYIWSYHRATNQRLPINLHGNYTISYDDIAHTLSIEEKAYIPHGLFGEKVANISFILGNNGCGKTSLIFDMIHSITSTTYQQETVIVCEENHTIQVFGNVDCWDDSVYPLYPLSAFVSQNRIILYSDVFDAVHYDQKSDLSYTNISTMYLLYKQANQIDQFFYTEIRKQLAFYYVYNKKVLPFPIPHKLQMYIPKNPEEYAFAQQFPLEQPEPIELLDLSKRPFFENTIRAHLLYAIRQKIGDDMYHICKEEFEQCNQKGTFLSFLNRLLKIKHSEWMENVIAFYTYLRQSYPAYVDVGAANHYVFRLDLKKEEINHGIHFFELYFKIADELQPVQFKWCMSSGENALFSLFARFYDVYQDDNAYAQENVLIFMDEIDHLLHPIWQQQIVQFLIHHISKIVNGKQIQFVLSSHSPILLSDIPQGNVIYLKETGVWGEYAIDERIHKETFAANISSLYYDAFVMHKGICGAFARDTINTLLHALVTVEKDAQDRIDFTYHSMDDIKQVLHITSKAELRQYIELIGDEIIQMKLMTLLRYCEGA